MPNSELNALVRRIRDAGREDALHTLEKFVLIIRYKKAGRVTPIHQNAIAF